MSREAGGWPRTCPGLAAVAALTLCLGLTLAPALAQDETRAAGTSASPGGAPDRDGPSQAAVGEYRIGVEDVLMITVREDPVVTGSVIVRPDGKIGVNLIEEDILAAGKTVRELEREIAEKLSEFIEDPTVDVQVTAVNSFKIYVLGEVNGQGMFQVKAPLRVLQALAYAGGFTQFADKGDILLIRQTASGEVRSTFNYKKILSGEEENFFLRPGDTIVVQ